MMNRDSLGKRISYSSIFALIFLFLFGFTALPIENVAASELPEGLAAAVEDTLGIGLIEPQSSDLTMQTSFYPTSRQYYDRFGSSVAISGNVAVIVAERGDLHGEAFVFVRVNGVWEKKAELNSSNSNGIGSSVAIEDNVIVVGSGNGAYIYNQPSGGWKGVLEEDTILRPSSYSDDDLFDMSISISGDTIVLGTPKKDLTKENQGSVYVFEKPLGGWSGTIAESAVLYSSTAEQNDYLGSSVSIEGDTVIAGGSLSDIFKYCVEGVQTALIFQKPSVGGWSGAITESATLTASDGTDRDCFGISVIIKQNYALVGAPGNDTVYVYEKPDGDWGGDYTEDAKLLASNPSHYIYLGGSISVSGDKIVVGGNIENTPVSGVGGMEAYLFSVPENWEGEITEDAILAMSNPERQADFSNSVAIFDNQVIIGARGEDQPVDDPYVNLGAAYVYDMPAGGWSGTLTEDYVLYGLDARQDVQFGYSIAVEGDIAVIGAPNYDNGNLVYGQQAITYVYKQIGDEWEQVAELTPSEALQDKQRFGISIDIFEDTIVVGAPDENNRGAVYIFEKPGAGWVGEIHEKIKLTSPGEEHGFFGRAVAVEENVIVVGSPNDDKVYVFEKPESGWIDTLDAAVLTFSADTDYQDLFGISVDLANDTIVVGANQGGIGPVIGIPSVFVYQKSGNHWENMMETAKLSVSNSATQKVDGAVRINGDTIAAAGLQNLGSEWVDTAVFIYERPNGGWKDMVQTATLSTTSQQETDGAISGLVLTDNYVIDRVVTWNEADEVTKQAYLYSKPQGGWKDMVETVGINLIYDKRNSHFGGPIAILDDTVLIGIPEWDENSAKNTDNGIVFAYKIIETPDALNGSAEITSDQPIVAIGRPHMGAEIMGYNGINSGANTLYLPMLFNNIWNYTSTFTVENTTSSTATYTLTFKDGGNGTTSCVMSGETLPGHGVRTYDVTNLGACDSGYLPDPWAGGAKIESDQPLVAIATPKVEGTDPVTYNAFTGGADTVYLPMLFRNVWGYTSAFYVQNLDSTQNATITIDFYDALGHFTCRYEDSSPIGPAVTRGYWVPSMSCNDGNSFPAEGWAGSAVIESSGGEEIVAIGRPHMGTEVAAYNGFTEGGTSNYLPMLFRNMWGYTSAVYIQNVSGGTITEPIEIVFYDAAGNYTCTYRDNEDLADKATRGYWIPNVNCNAGGSFPGEGWVGSATIHTSGAAIAVGRPHLSDGEVVAYGAFTGGATEAYVPMLFRKYNGNESALYIQNLGDSDATVTITYYDEESGYYCAMAQDISPLSTSGVWLAGLDDSVCVP